MKKTTVRSARKRDEPAIRALIAKYPKELEQKRLPSYRDFFVVEQDGVIVACAAAERLIEIRSVAEDPNLRGKKLHLADALVNICLDRAEKGRYRTAVLSTDIPDFFERFGFEIKAGRTAMFLDLGNGKRKRPKS
ncbi:MAG: hypothetical protein M1275_03100 [Patescibacteria group bacterium]|nr:hypothetical protein [Patescibacteria group bacterium]